MSPSGISELGSTTTKTDAAEKSMSVGRESLKVLGGNKCHVAGFTTRGQLWRNMALMGLQSILYVGICQNWVRCDDVMEVLDHRTTYGQKKTVCEWYKKFQRGDCLCTPNPMTGKISIELSTDI
jgi:hypothetical protein